MLEVWNRSCESESQAASLPEPLGESLFLALSKVYRLLLSLSVSLKPAEWHLQVSFLWWFPSFKGRCIPLDPPVQSPSSVYHNRSPQTWWTFSCSWKARSWRSRCSLGWFLLRPFSYAWKVQLLAMPSPGLCLVHTSALVSRLFFGLQSYLIRAPPEEPHLTLIISKYSHLGGPGIQLMNFTEIQWV